MSGDAFRQLCWGSFEFPGIWRWKILQQQFASFLTPRPFNCPIGQRRDDLFGHNGGSVSRWEPPSISEGWQGFAVPLLFHFKPQTPKIIISLCIQIVWYKGLIVSSVCKLDCFCANKIEGSLADCETFGWEGGMLQVWQTPPDLCLDSYLPLYHTITDAHLPYLALHSVFHGQY